MKYYREAADNYSTEPHQNSSYNECLLKIVDIGVYSKDVDYAELIKVHVPL